MNITLKKKLSQADYFLIAVNMLPVLGVWLRNWNPKEVFVIYCFETIIIGIFNLFRMGLTTMVKKKDEWTSEGGASTKVSGLFFMIFFIIHFGLFVIVQMTIFFAFTGIADEHKLNFFNFFYKWPQLISIEAWYVVLIFAASYGFRMMTEFVWTGQYKTASMGLLMFQPYSRIFVQQFTVILGAFILMFGGGKIFILVFAVCKIFIDVFIDLDGYIAKALKQANDKSGQQ